VVVGACFLSNYLGRADFNGISQWGAPLAIAFFAWRSLAVVYAAVPAALVAAWIMAAAGEGVIESHARLDTVACIEYQSEGSAGLCMTARNPSLRRRLNGLDATASRCLKD